MEKQIKQAIETYNKFATIYAKYIENKLLQFQLNKFITLLPKKPKVLDAGAGAGRDAKYLKEEKAKVTCIDLSDGMIKEAKKNKIKVEKIDMRDLTFDKDSFDGIWCMASFSDIPKKDSKKTIKNFHKILKKQGIIYIAVKNGKGEKIINKARYNNAPRFYAFYKQDELKQLLENNNFTILEASTSSNNKWVEIFAKKT